MNSTHENANEHAENSINYPGAKASLEECVRAYDFVLACYDKVYDRINITLTMAGLVLMVGVESITKDRILSQNPWAIVAILLSAIGLILVAKSLFSLTSLLKSSGLQSIDPKVVREHKFYSLPEQAVEMFWIDRYIKMTDCNREICQMKQKKLDSSVIDIVYAVLSICLSLLINNIGGY